MKFALIAQDIAYCQAADLLIKQLCKEGHEIFSVLSHGKQVEGTLEAAQKAVEAADVVWLGMSSSFKLAHFEVYAANLAQKLGKPYGFYAETYGVTNGRVWLHELYKDASFVFVLNDDEAQVARTLFSKGTVYATGNPVWEDFFFPKKTREEVRRTLGIPVDHSLILSPGGKTLEANVELWEAVAHVQSMRAEDTHLIITPHPGDNNFSEYPHLYDKYLEVYGTRIVQKIEMSSSEILAGADLVIQNGSTIGIEAAHLLIPVIDYFGPCARAKLLEVLQSEKWPPCDEMGVSVRVDDNKEKLLSLATSALSKKMVKLAERQGEVYQKPEKLGATVQTMVNVLKDQAK